MDQNCPRCGAPLHFVDHAAPLFCGQCGLPQLRVSEDALATAEPTQQQAPEGAALNWPRAFRILVTAAAVGVAIPCILPGALASGAVTGISLLMTPVLALICIFSYGRSRHAVSTAAGAHMGAVLGLLMGSLVAFVTGVAGFAMRYGYRSRALDDTINQAISQLPAQLTAQMASTGPPPPELLAFIASPEFRAGSFIAGHVFSLLLLVAAGSLCGWMSAAILRTRQAPREG